MSVEAQAMVPTHLQDVENLAGTPRFHEVTPEGLVVLTVQGDQLSARDLDAVYRFRLQQYRYRGWVSEEALAKLGLTAEPYGAAALTDLHTLVIEQQTAIVRGYGTLASPPILPGQKLGDTDRNHYVIERDYGIDLAEILDPRTPTEAVKEGKRLIRDYGMPRSRAGASVPWWVYLAWTTGCVSVLSTSNGAAIVGDAKERGATYQLALIGFSVRSLECDALAPGKDDIFAPMWTQEDQSHPFILTDEERRLSSTREYLHEVLLSASDTSISQLLKDFRGTCD
ncbi:hypothetical protein HJ588_03705 [Flexivirga sp. ID2601S]|uniref:Uncharacterized protein n=1 Tax=Flexivirga aerilata TaxID=1656889 RepID=A0A849AGI4_9MICO|nr:hypothetical protein [Flexivirga aerilata]NNG38381.1 hypothetical protein [Flexivirga aerilata]